MIKNILILLLSVTLILVGKVWDNTNPDTLYLSQIKPKLKNAHWDYFHTQEKIRKQDSAFKAIALQRKKDSLTYIRNYQVKLYEQLIAKFNKRKDFKGAVLIAEEGEIVYQAATGYQGIKRKQVVNTQTPFQLASVSKQFTAFAVMILMEHNKLVLDSQVQYYLSNFPYQKITVRHLLQHTSGLPEYINDKNFEKYLPSFAIRNIDLLNIMAKRKLPLAYEPGSIFSYSNTGYAMLALIIEKASGMKYSDFLRNEIFTPLEMNNTYCHNEKNIPYNLHVIFKYRELSKAQKLDFITGDKGIYSTLSDMFKWDRALYQYSLVSERTMDEVYKKGITTTGKEFNYGFGWRIGETTQGNKFVAHYGLWGTYNPAIVRLIDQKKTIIFLGEALKPGFGSKKIVNPLMEAMQTVPMAQK